LRGNKTPAEFHGEQKGSIENAGGIIRRYLPKKLDSAVLTQLQLDWIGTEKGVRKKVAVLVSEGLHAPLRSAWSGP
jgi:hypothetical protein